MIQSSNELCCVYVQPQLLWVIILNWLFFPELFATYIWFLPDWADMDFIDKIVWWFKDPGLS